jgi:hypothetical protein
MIASVEPLSIAESYPNAVAGGAGSEYACSLHVS